MVRNLLKLLTLFLIIALPCYFLETYSGPFRWLAELQIWLWGSYREGLTLIALIVLLAGACLVLRTLFLKALGKPASFRVSEFDQALRPNLRLNFGRFITPRRLVTAALMMPSLVIAAYAARDEWEYRHTTEQPVHVNIADIIAGRQLPSRFVTVEDATYDFKLDHGIIEGSAESPTHYVPLLPADYRQGEPIHGFVEVQHRYMAALRARPESLFTGLVKSTRLPGLVREGFLKDNLPPASDYVLIRFNETPASLHTSAIGLFLMAIGIAGLFIFQQWRVTRRAAQPAKIAVSSTPSQPLLSRTKNRL